jgi:hypothetical protein
MRVVGCFFMVPGLVMLCRFQMVTSGVGMMFRSLAMMLSRFLGHVVFSLKDSFSRTRGQHEQTRTGSAKFR